MKLFKLLLIGMFLMGTTSIAMADTIGFNPGNGAVTIDKLSGQVTSNYDVTTQLGTDGVLNDGDQFTENFTLGITFGDLNGSHAVQYGYNSNGFLPSVYAVATGITGEITQFVGNGTDTTAANPDNILNDTFKIALTGGSISLYYDSSDDGVLNGTALGTFNVTGGLSTDYTPGGNQTLTATVGLDLKSSSLTPGVWFVPDANGTDVTTLNVPILLGLADSSNNLVAFSSSDGGTPNDPTDDSLTVTVQDNGTTAQFSAVPEPTTLVLLGLGLIGMAALGRKKVTL
jgi:hypothetical protein